MRHSNDTRRKFVDAQVRLNRPFKLWGMELRPTIGSQWNLLRDNRFFREDASRR